MRVFLSWSGDRSKSIALAFHSWLPLVLHYVEPWSSQADVDAGERWAQSVAEELAASNFGLLCLTSENIDSPWLLFEAGALTKSLDSSKVIPVLLDLDFSDITGPLAQFQAKKLVKTGVEEVLRSLQASAEVPIPEERLKLLFEALWPDLESSLAEIASQVTSTRQVRPQSDVLEELVSSVRSLDTRIRDTQEVFDESAWSSRRGRRRPISPGMLLELRHIVGQGPEDPIVILIVGSVLRDDLPWLYEMSLEAYRAVELHRRDARSKVLRFLRGLEAIVRGPFSREFGIDDRLLHWAYSEMQEYAEQLRTPLPNKSEPESSSE